MADSHDIRKAKIEAQMIEGLSVGDIPELLRKIERLEKQLAKANAHESEAASLYEGMSEQLAEAQKDSARLVALLAYNLCPGLQNRIEVDWAIKNAEVAKELTK